MDIRWILMVAGMVTRAADAIAAWLLTYAVHSAVLILITWWLVTRPWARWSSAAQHAMWTGALLLGFVTATLQVVAGVTPLAGALRLLDREAKTMTAIQRGGQNESGPRFFRAAVFSVSYSVVAVSLWVLGSGAHELAHVVRRDTMWLWLAHVAGCLAWFQPLHVLAFRRMRLARVAEWLQVAPPASLAMGADGSPFVQRIRRLTDPAWSPGSARALGGRGAALAIAGCAMLALAVAPRIDVAGKAGAGSDSRLKVVRMMRGSTGTGTGTGTKPLTALPRAAEFEIRQEFSGRPEW